MSDGKPLNDWVKDLESLQRQYVAAWADLMQKAPPAAAPPPFANPFGANPFATNPFATNPFAANPFGATPFGPITGMFGAPAPAAAAPAWQESLEQWSRLAGNPGAQSDTVERVVESGKAYVDMIRTMLGAAGTGAGIGVNPAQAWQDAMRGGFGQPAAFAMPGFDAASNPFVKAVHDIAGKGAHGFAELPAAFAAFLEPFKQENLSWLRTPAFGLAREHQEHYQRTALALVAYQDALRGYNAQMLKASQRGLELLEGKLAERSEPGRTIDSPRALYDLWVDAAEDAYAEIALTEEFAKAYGELANAQMRLRAQVQAEVERIGRDLGMPTRSELNSVHQRVHDLRREFRDSRGTSSVIDDLEQQIVELRAEVAALKSPARAPAAKPEGGAAATRQKAGAPVATEVTAPVATQAKRTTKPPSKPVAKTGARSATPSVVATERPPAANEAAPTTKRAARAQQASTRTSKRARRSSARGSAAPSARPASPAKPAPVAKSAAPVASASFGDAIAAMRRRVARSGSVKSAAAKVFFPQKALKHGKPAHKSKRK
jgi:class III poly(R)-hydroxyalkanoic acid synthase PhaE subunit